METIGTFLNKRSSLTTREVELVIVIIATQWQGEYVQAAHVKMCLDLGYPQDVMDAIKNGETPDLPDAREKAVYDLCQIAMAPGGGASRPRRAGGSAGPAWVLFVGRDGDETAPGAAAGVEGTAVSKR